MEKKDLNFSFEFVDKPKSSWKINKLNSKEAYKELDIPVKLIKSNKDLFFILYTTISIASCSFLIFPQI